MLRLKKQTDQFTAVNSISKRSLELGGILGGAPLEPYLQATTQETTHKISSYEQLAHP